MSNVKYKTGEPVQVDDLVHWEAQGAGSRVQRRGCVVAVVYAGTNIYTYMPNWLRGEILEGRITGINKSVQSVSLVDRVLVLVKESGYNKPTKMKKPVLKAPLPGSLIYDGR